MATTGHTHHPKRHISCVKLKSDFLNCKTQSHSQNIYSRQKPKKDDYMCIYRTTIQSLGNGLQILDHMVVTIVTCPFQWRQVELSSNVCWTVEGFYEELDHFKLTMLGS